jgi:hypothetical protein
MTPTASPTVSILLDAVRHQEVMFMWPLMPIIRTDREVAPTLKFILQSSLSLKTSDGHWTFVSGMSGVPLR